MTNQLLQKNADMLKMGTIDAAREAEKSIVDIQTLQHTNNQLISTLDEDVYKRQPRFCCRTASLRDWRE